MSEKAGKESQYSLASPPRSTLVGRGKRRDMGCVGVIHWKFIKGMRSPLSIKEISHL